MGKLSGSMAMVADGYHSLTDGGNNIAGLVVTGYAYAPPDEGHPYGHRKFETAATLGHRPRAAERVVPPHRGGAFTDGGGRCSPRSAPSPGR